MKEIRRKNGEAAWDYRYIQLQFKYGWYYFKRSWGYKR